MLVLLTYLEYQATVLPLLLIFFLVLRQKDLTRISYRFILPGSTMFEERRGGHVSVFDEMGFSEAGGYIYVWYCNLMVVWEQNCTNCKYICDQIVCLHVC